MKRIFKIFTSFSSFTHDCLFLICEISDLIDLNFNLSPETVLDLFNCSFVSPSFKLIIDTFFFIKGEEPALNCCDLSFYKIKKK